MAEDLSVRIERIIDRVDRDGVDHVELRRATAEQLGRLVGHDLGVWATVDPTTLMWTHCVLEGGERDHELEEGVFRNEYLQDDVLKLTDLAARPGRADTLRSATGGDPARSRRYQELYRPRGFTDELRLVFSDGDTAWGALCLLRTDGGFRAEEAEALAAVGTTFARSLRRSLLREAVLDPDGLQEPPGLIVFGPGGAVLELTPQAADLLQGLDGGGVPAAVQALVARHDAGGRGEAVLARPDGGWLAFHVTALGEQRVVVVERPRPFRLADLIVRAHGLSERERQVVECVARGGSTKAIAATLFISEWTVQDHLKSIFDKLGVSSRQELVARVFFDHYGPRHDAGDTPSPYGWYLGTGSTAG